MLKKSFVVLVALIGFGISANAECIFGNFTYKEDGQTTAYINISNDCKFSMKDYESDFSASGNYEIVGSINYGGQNTIIFYINGTAHKGTIYFPTQGKWGISFDGIYFELNRR